MVNLKTDIFFMKIKMIINKRKIIIRKIKMKINPNKKYKIQ